MKLNSNISAIGVYAWELTDSQLRALAKDMYGEASRAAIVECKRLTQSLVLVELLCDKLPRIFELGDLSQVPPVQRNDSEQVPYDERYWSEDGSEEMGIDPPSKTPFRICFFLHCFELGKNLYMADGSEIVLPKLTRLPKRLKSKIQYEAP